jgi:hypothetical protein
MAKTGPLNRLLVLLLSFAFPTVRLIAAEGAATIAFYRATKDQAVYTKSPAKYEHVVVNDRTGRLEYYKERQPAHAIPKSAIESVIVKEMQVYTATGEPIPEAKSNPQSKSTRRVFRGYELIFKIKSPEGKNFSVFTEKNKQGFFETIIGKQSIGLQEFDLPFEPDESGGLEFTVYLREDAGSGKLKEMLSSFKELVILK